MNIKPYTVRAFLYKHFILCFLLLVVSGVSFGAITLDLFRIVLANVELFSEHGVVTALKIGAGVQSFELFCYASLGMFCYTMFKLAETTLVAKISNARIRNKKNIPQND